MIPAMSDQKSVTGARLQNDVVRPDSRQDERNGGEIDGRRELLPFDLLFAAHRLGGQTVEQVAGRADIGERTQRLGTELEMVGKRARKRVVEGKSVYVRVNHGGCRPIKQTNKQ